MPLIQTPCGGWVDPDDVRSVNVEAQHECHACGSVVKPAVLILTDGRSFRATFETTAQARKAADEFAESINNPYATSEDD